jgi:hypothetical protein
VSIFISFPSSRESEGTLVSEQRLSIAFVGDDDGFVAERFVHFSQRKDNLVSVVGLRQNVAGKGLAPQIPAQWNSGTLQDLAQGNAFIGDLRPILIRNGDGFPRHPRKIISFQDQWRGDVAPDSQLWGDRVPQLSGPKRARGQGW